MRKHSSTPALFSILQDRCQTFLTLNLRGLTQLFSCAYQNFTIKRKFYFKSMRSGARFVILYIQDGCLAPMLNFSGCLGTHGNISRDGPALLVYLVFEWPQKSWRFLRILEKNIKVWDKDEDSKFEIEDQILRIIEVWDIEVRMRSKILRFFSRPLYISSVWVLRLLWFYGTLQFSEHDLNLTFTFFNKVQINWFDGVKLLF